MAKVKKKRPPKSRVPKAKAKKTKAKKGKQKKAPKLTRLRVPTNRQDKLVDLKVTRGHNFLSTTKPALTEIYPMRQIEGNQYEVLDKPAYVSTIMKLILKIRQTNEMSEVWSLILWNINQLDILPPSVSVTFVRTFEKKDNDAMKKEIKRRGKGAVIFTKDNAEDQEDTGAALDHDKRLALAIARGDCVVSFGAEAIITAPNDQILEEAVQAIQDYIKTNDETRGLEYEIDINKQMRPFLLYGPNKQAGNREVYYDMTSHDAGISALYVDSGGDRAPGSELVGYSVGKLISSHAAYKFMNARSLFVGNDTVNKTFTIGNPDGIDEPSQIYLAKVASRAYLLEGRSVTHIVADHAENAKHLMNMPLFDDKKVFVDASQGKLNILEPIRTKDLDQYPERIISRFDMHIDNIIQLLSQFMPQTGSTNTDDFANATREILTNFFVNKKYWMYGAEDNIGSHKLFGIHDQYATLDMFGAYIVNAQTTNRNQNHTRALAQLNTIVNNRILPTIPALKKTTDPVIDRMMDTPYRVIDLTGMGTGSPDLSNPALNVMMITYLNVILPALASGDVIMIHGMDSMAQIAKTITNILRASQRNLDIVFTESSADKADTILQITDRPIDFAMVDLYDNVTDVLHDKLDMDGEWCEKYSQEPSSFFVKSGQSVDFIKLDNII